MSALAGTVCCLQFALWEPPAFTGSLQDAQKAGETAAKDTQKAGKKAAKDTQKAGKKAAKDTQNVTKKAAKDTQKAGGKALRDIQNAGGKAVRDTKKSLKPEVGAKKTNGGLPADDNLGGDPPVLVPPNNEPTLYPSEQREEPKRAPEFSLGSPESTIQGEDKSVYEKLGISGLAPPEGETERGNQGTDAPQDEPAQEHEAGSRR
jgi:hypothetical protein